MNYQAIATHLNVELNRIKSVDTWANCLFVVVKGLGARFVSKKIGIMLNPYIAEAQRLINEAKESSGSGEDRCYKFIYSDKAVKWAVEIISKFNCGMDESLLDLLFQNIESVKPEFRTFQKKVKDGLDEAAFWAAENAKWAAEYPDVAEAEDSFDEWEFQTKIGHQW